MGGGTNSFGSRPRFVAFGATEETELKHNVTSHTQNAGRQIHLHRFYSLPALRIVAISHDPGHPNVGAKRIAGRSASRRRAKVVLPENGEPIA